MTPGEPRKEPLADAPPTRQPEPESAAAPAAASEPAPESPSEPAAFDPAHAAERGRRVRRLPRPAFSTPPPPPFFPRTFQGRLSLAFILVFAMAVGIVTAVTVVILDRDLRDQEEINLTARTNAIADVVRVEAESIVAYDVADVTVVSASGKLNSQVTEAIGDPIALSDYANSVAQADLRLRFGLISTTPAGTPQFLPANSPATFYGYLTASPGKGQARDQISHTELFTYADPKHIAPTWALEVSLSAPYTTRASTITGIIGFLFATAVAALFAAALIAYILARGFTRPLRRLTETARAMAEGDLTRRVAADKARTGGQEIAELSRQFNAMADQVEETMDVIRADRDAGREFLADVSHELRTPLAALRTFNELLQEKAGDDREARAEFLESSRTQIERLDWLAQNLLELSKLDSGLVRLDLRPEDLGTTVQSAVEQSQVAAHRRGVELSVSVPSQALVVRHDPQRMGQVLSNLIGNALKFTPRGGTVRVTLRPHPRGARIQVIDTGVGIDPAELPKIFDRFYRGSRSSEARSSGSGLGLAIVRSVVDMHAGRVMVESRVGGGSTFTVTLPVDPRTASGEGPGHVGGAGETSDGSRAGSGASSGGRGANAARSGVDTRQTKKKGKPPKTTISAKPPRWSLPKRRWKPGPAAAANGNGNGASAKPPPAPEPVEPADESISGDSKRK